MPRKVEISHRTIIFSVLFLLFLWFLYFIKDILVQLFIALLLTTMFDPIVTKLSLLKIPRGVAILISYILLFGFFGIIIALLAPTLVEQTTNFAISLPGYMGRLGITPVIAGEISKEFLTRVGDIPGQILKIGASLLSNIFSLFAILVFTFYFLLSRNKLGEQLGFFFGEAQTQKLTSVLEKLEEKLGGWARGELTLMFIVALMNYAGLVLLRVPYALPLAILAGLLEIVPYLGPIFAAIPAAIIGFGISSVTGFGVILLALLVQQLEGYVFIPKVMGKSVGVSPIVILLALAVGQRLGGVVGMLISVPLVITIQVLIKEYFIKD